MLYLAYQSSLRHHGAVRSRWPGLDALRLAAASAMACKRPCRNLTAAYELIARAGLTHARPAYGIDSVTRRQPRGRRDARSRRR